ncbi:MAG TPA: tandem-95 repeat protein [Methylococcaceae bacterium]|nr:tandem-95 repeat protein [Methylococcaceae bacterium]
MAGDGRVNENIGLTSVHHLFHSEHNRLADHVKSVILESGDVPFLNEWLLTPVLAVPADLSTLVWNGERLFQAAKFGTEMQYQHLVFEEFARTIQPNIDVFIPNTQNYQTEINPAIVAEFAHTVYRFGHSMLLEQINILDLDNPTAPKTEIGLVQAFLNPLAFAASGPTADQAAGAIAQGLARQVGNEIDEFVTDALRNNLLGLPLDLASINLARARDTGIPSLNAARREFFTGTGDSNLTPYTSWADFVQHIKHPESLVNFIAAYGTHASITAATTLADKRAAASLIVFGDVTDPGPDGIAGTADDVVITAAPADRLDFLLSQGAWASGADGVTITGLDSVDFWIGGLAEMKTPFGGMLGSTFNFVFENQLEKLQNGDRFYYLERTAGLNFLTELENNSFAKLIMANTDATHLPGLVFQTNLILEVNQARQYNESVIGGPDGIVLDDPLTPVDESADNLPVNADPAGGSILVPLVIRDNPNTVGADSNYLQYTGDQHVVLGGTNPGDVANPSGNDILIASEGDDTLYGDGGNDRLEGGYGNDQIRGGAGDDIMTDIGGDDVFQGDDGNDVIQGGNGLNLLIGGFGNDFIVGGEDANEGFGGPGNDFMLGSDGTEQNLGNEGDDWLEGGLLDGTPGDNFDPLGRDLIVGNDVYIGSGGPDIMNSEGGDDIMVGSAGPGDKYLGASGFDWATFKNDATGVGMDLNVRAFDVAPGPIAAGIVARFSSVEGLAGSAFSDYLRGSDDTAAVIAVSGAQGSVLTNFDLVSGLRDFVGAAGAGADAILGTADDQFGAGNIILGGDGSDLMEGRSGDDLIDGDQWLNVRISVRANTDGTGAEIATFESMVPLVPLMLNGTYNPGQLVIAREILPGSGGFSFDTVAFSGNLADYVIATNADGSLTVTDSVVGRDGTDRLSNIERLQFNDQAVVLAPGLNAGPEGLLTVNDPTPEVGSLLTVSAAGVTDADNTATGGAIPGPFTFFWQFETVPGSGVFEDIIIRTGLGAETVTGPSFTVPASFDDGLPAGGTAIRVRAVYMDQNGVLETVFSAPTAPVAAVGANDPPAGTDATVTTLEDTAFVFSAATFGFTDVDVGDSLSAVRIDTLPLAGSLTLAGVPVAAGEVIPVADINAGNLAFTPALNANGLAIASFTFSVADQAGAFDPIPNTLTVNVTAVNDAPTAVADTLAAVEDTVAVFAAADLVANDTDPEGDAFTIVSVTSGVGGTAVLNLDGTITFTPNANFTGPATFTYTVSDGLATSLPATVTVNVAPVNDAPVPVADILAAINEDTSTVIAATALLANDIDVDGDVLSIDSVISGLGGTATLNLDGTVTFTPNPNFSGAADFAYTVFDGTVSSAPVSALVSVGVSPVNDPPAGTSATITAAEDTPRILTAADFGFTDVDVGDSLSAVRIDTLPLAGALTLSGASILAGALVTAADLAAGNLAFTPAPNANGPGYASFDFSVADQGLAFALVPSTLTIDVAPVNDAPVILTPLVIDDLTPTEGQVLNATPATLTDADGLTGAAFSYQWQSSANGAAFANIAGATALSFTPTQAQVGAVLRLIQSYIDDEGTLEQVVSAITGIVGDLLTGTAAANVLTGTLGDDVINGLAGNDRLFGLAGNDLLDGGAGSDLLDGGLGADNMIGGLGNDTFVVDDAGDVVSELAGGGTDTVQTTLASYTLGNTLENLTYTGAGNFSGIGNALVNTIRGGSGNDTLDGDLGNDLLIGGLGNDTYLVNNRLDNVVETGGGGVDTILSTAGVYVLGANVENLVYVGTAGASLIGNGLANSITGGIGNDALRGGNGNDVLDGGAGNDSLLGEIGADLLLGGLGNDVLRGGDGGGGDTLDGGDGNDSLFGDRGDDVLTGGAGDDILNGGLGNDVFVFGAGFGHDRINGFDANATGGQDLLDISALGVTAASFGTDVSIAVGQFIAGGALDTQVTIGTDTIVINGVNGVGANAISQADFMLA